MTPSIKRHAYILYPSYLSDIQRIPHPKENPFKYQKSSGGGVWGDFSPDSSYIDALLNNLNGIQNYMRALSFFVQTPDDIFKSVEGSDNPESGLIASYIILKYILKNDVSTMTHGDFVWIHYIGKKIIKSDPLTGKDVPCLEMVYGQQTSVRVERTYGLPSTELLKIAKVAAPGVKVLFTIDANDTEGICELPFGDVIRHNPDTLILSDVWCISRKYNAYSDTAEAVDKGMFTQELITTIQQSHHLDSVTKWIKEIITTRQTDDPRKKDDISLSYGLSGAASKSVFASTTTDNYASIAQSPVHQCVVSTKPQRKIRVVVRLDNIKILNNTISDPTPYRLHSIDIKLRILHTNARRLHIDPKAPVEYESCTQSSKLYRRNYTIEENTECAYTIRIKLEGGDISLTDVDDSSSSLAKYESYLYRLNENIELSLWATVTNTKLPKSCANMYCSIESMAVIHNNDLLVINKGGTNKYSYQIHTVTSNSNVYGVCEVNTEATDTTWKDHAQQSRIPNASILWRSHPSITTKTLYHVVTVGICMKYFKGYTIQNPMLILSTIGGHTHLSETVPTNNTYAYAHYTTNSDFEYTVTNKDTIVPIAYFKIDENLNKMEDERWSGLNVQLTSMNIEPNFRTMPSKDKMDTTLYLAISTIDDQYKDDIDDCIYTPAPQKWEFGHTEITSYGTYQTDTNQRTYVIDQRPTISLQSSGYASAKDVTIDENTPIYFTLSHSNVNITDNVRASSPDNLNANVVDWISPTCFRLNKAPLMSLNTQSSGHDCHYIITLNHSISPSTDFKYLTNTYVPHTECCLFSVNSENIDDYRLTKTINQSYILTPDATSNLNHYLGNNTFDDLHSNSHPVNSAVTIVKSSVNGSHKGFQLNGTSLIRCLPSWKTLQYDTIDGNNAFFEFSIVMLWKYVSGATTRLFGSDNLLCIEWNNTNIVLKLGSLPLGSSPTIISNSSRSTSHYYILGCTIKYVNSTSSDYNFDCALYINPYDDDGNIIRSSIIDYEDSISVTKANMSYWTAAELADADKDYRKILAINMPNNDLTSNPSHIIIGMCSVYDKVINVKNRMDQVKADWQPPSS